jgi:hypothetical protein
VRKTLQQSAKEFNTMPKKTVEKPIKCGSGAFRQSLHKQPDWVELQRIVPLQEACRLLNVSKDTIRREFKDKIVKLSPRRYGMRLCDALKLER